jgi:hypothetical protein
MQDAISANVRARMSGNQSMNDHRNTRDPRIGRQTGIHATVRAACWLAALALSGNAIAGSDLPQGAKCRQEIRAVDDQADVDIQAIDRLIILLEGEVGDRAMPSGGPLDRLRERLDAAKLQRTSLLDKQHDDLNVIRARCDRLRDDVHGAAAPVDAALSER